MLDKYGTGPDPYCYPGTAVLRNLYDLRDEEALSELERCLTDAAVAQIEFEPPPYDLSSMQRIHRTLFGGIYEWAGEIRTVDIHKHPTRFCNVNRIEPEAAKQFDRLAAANWFESMERREFVAAVAEFYGEVNMIHPFREGNGRAQRLLFEQIIVNAGYDIDWWQVDQVEWVHANIAAAFCDPSPLIAIFDRCVGDMLV